MNQTYDAIIKEDDEIFGTLIITYPVQNSSAVWGMNIIIHQIIKQFSINPANIFSIELTKKSSNRELMIKYSKFDFSSIICLDDKEQQIIELLDILGYSQEKLKDISYEEEWLNDSSENLWIVRIAKHYNPNECLLKYENENILSEKISNILGFDVKVLMI